MSRIKLLLDVAEDLKRLAESMEELANALTEDEMPTKVHLDNSERKDSPIVIDVEQVRKVLADKYDAGKRDGVKELVRKFGGTKLTDIDPSKYPEMLKEAANL